MEFEPQELFDQFKVKTKRNLFKLSQVASQDEHKSDTQDFTSLATIPVAFTVAKNIKAHEQITNEDYTNILKTFLDRGWIVDEYHFEETGIRSRLHMHGIVKIVNKEELYRNEYWKIKGYYITRKLIYNEDGWKVYIRKDI